MSELEKSRCVDAAKALYAQWKSTQLQAVQRCMTMELVGLLRGGVWASDQEKRTWGSPKPDVLGVHRTCRGVGQIVFDT